MPAGAQYQQGTLPHLRLLQFTRAELDSQQHQRQISDQYTQHRFHAAKAYPQCYRQQPE
ncbi:hypothetical protein D3C78_1832340 [compost metagenome]